MHVLSVADARGVVRKGIEVWLSRRVLGGVNGATPASGLARAVASAIAVRCVATILAVLVARALVFERRWTREAITASLLVAFVVLATGAASRRNARRE